jgi:peroxiredoxin/tetratricopeptide (TPR) repeat protein
MIALMLALWGGTAHAATARDVMDCLAANDVPCAEDHLAQLGASMSQDASVVRQLARTHFFAGEYPQALAALQRAHSLGWEDRYDDLALYERTLYATSGWTEERRGRFVVRFKPGVDALLIEDAFETLQLAEKHLAPLIGGPPPGSTIVEIFPDTRSFIAASSLMKEDVETTGVVALSKWSRLLVTSPRSLPRGYGWQDTIAHEYIHLVVAHHSHDHAPVWLQEAIAKYLDNRWRDGADGFRLSLRSQGYLAEALRRDALVSFEEMHPSLAKLETAERAALAYAQLATLMSWAFEEGGKDVLVRLLPALAQGAEPDEALAAAVGEPDFASVMKAWKASVEGMHLEEGPGGELPVVLEGGDDMALDPVLAERRDLARYVTLGDILREHGEEAAALVEYRRAVPEIDSPSPLLSNKIASVQLSMDELDAAQAELTESLRVYPEFTLSHKTLGEVLAAKGSHASAMRSYRRAASYNPFDPTVQNALVKLYERLGRLDMVERHRNYLKIQRHGGEERERTPIHEVEGAYELPTYGPRPSVSEIHPLMGKRAPEFRVAGLDGTPIELDALRGTVVVVDFWATWCGPCRKAMPELSALHDDIGARGGMVVGVSDESAGKVAAFLSRSPVSYPIGVDRDGSTKARYEVAALPTAFVIGADGVVIDVVVGGGGASLERIRAAVERGLIDG